MDKIEKEKFKREIKTKIKTITLNALEYLLSTMESLAELSLDRKAAFRVLHNNFRQDSWSKSETCKLLDSLRRRGYLEINQDGKNKSVQFTDKAKLKLVEQISRRISTDNQYRFLSFDIPEKLRKKRDGFRLTIKKIGFIQIQKSLWVINKNVSDLVEMAAYKYGVEKYIAYIVSDHTDIDGIIDKKFITKMSKDEKK